MPSPLTPATPVFATPPQGGVQGGVPTLTPPGSETVAVGEGGGMGLSGLGEGSEDEWVLEGAEAKGDGDGGSRGGGKRTLRKPSREMPQLGRAKSGGTEIVDSFFKGLTRWGRANASTPPSAASAAGGDGTEGSRDPVAAMAAGLPADGGEGAAEGAPAAAAATGGSRRGQHKRSTPSVQMTGGSMVSLLRKLPSISDIAAQAEPHHARVLVRASSDSAPHRITWSFFAG